MFKFVKAKKAKEEIYKGGILTGAAILENIRDGKIEIEPFNHENLNPNSYNLTLNPKLLVYLDSPLDYKNKNKTMEIIMPEDGFVLKPGTLYIGATNERCASDHFVPMLDGRSSLGRLGISAHVCAGFGDIGFNGTWTLEITCVEPVKIYPNMEICQVSYFAPCGNTSILYRGRYQGQKDPTASRSFKQKEVYVLND